MPTSAEVRLPRIVFHALGGQRQSAVETSRVADGKELFGVGTGLAGAGHGEVETE